MVNERIVEFYVTKTAQIWLQMTLYYCCIIPEIFVENFRTSILNAYIISLLDELDTYTFENMWLFVLFI